MKFYRYHNEKGISLEAMQEWQSYNGGHAEEGMGENSAPGVCCCDDEFALVRYLRGVSGVETWRENGGEVVVFEGEFVESCGDGDIAYPVEILERIDINDFIDSFDESEWRR